MSVIIDITRQVGVNLSSIGSGWFVDKDQGQITEKIYTAVDNIDSGLVDAALEAKGFDRIPEEMLPSMQGDYTTLDFAKNNFVLSPGLNDKDSKLVIVKDMTALKEALDIDIKGGMSNLQFKVDLAGGYSKNKGANSAAVKLLFYYYNRTHSLGLRNIERLNTNTHLLAEERGVNRPLHYISDIYYGYSMYITLELSSDDSALKEKIKATASGEMSYGALTAHIQGKFQSDSENTSSKLNMTMSNSSKGLSGCLIDPISVIGREFQSPLDYIAYIEKLESYLDNYIALHSNEIHSVPVAFGILPIPFNSLDLNFQTNSDYTSYYQDHLLFLNKEYILLQDNLAKIDTITNEIKAKDELLKEYLDTTYSQYLRQVNAQCKKKERQYSKCLYELQQLRFESTENDNISLLENLVSSFLGENDESDMTLLGYDLDDLSDSYNRSLKQIVDNQIAELTSKMENLESRVANSTHIEIGDHNFYTPNDHELFDGNTKRYLYTPVVFKKQFNGTPAVTSQLAGVDVGNEHNFRVDTWVEDITEVGCTIVFQTWSVTQVFYHRVTWIATGSV